MPYTYRIGRVSKPHGLAGDVVLRLFRPRRGLTQKKKKARAIVALAHPETTEERVLVLLRAKSIAPERLIAHFEGVDDRDSAEALYGFFLDLDPEALPGLLADDVDAAFGARVVDGTGRVLGEVVDIRDNGAQALLLLNDEDGDLMIPAPFIQKIEDGIVTVELPDGLLEINE